MDVELSSLKWNNQHKTVYQAISGLQKNKCYADITLACDGHYYPVHKLVLAMCSEYFSDIFQRTNCIDPVVILPDIKCSDLELLLEFMYNGQVYVRQNELSSLMEAAECLRVKGLAIPDEEPKKSGCSNIQQRIKQPSPPSKRKRTDEPRTVDSSLSRPDMLRGSSLACNVLQSQRTDGLPPYEPQNICSDDNVFRPLKHIKLEEENEGLDTTMKSVSSDVRRYEPENVGNATDAHDFIVKEELLPHSSYVDEDNVGPLQQIKLEKSELDLDVSMKSNSSECVKEGPSTEQEYQPCHKCGGKMGECLRKNRKGAYVLMLRCRKRGCQTHRSINK